MNIKNAETQRLARELAAATGETITSAITVAVQERLERVRTEADVEYSSLHSRVSRIATDAAGRWSADLRERDHGDLLYDELGAPR